MSLQLVHELWGYHHWANRRLFDVTAALGEGLAGRDVGTQFSEPTIRRMLTHIYASDALWLQRWNGNTAATMPGGDITTLGQLRPQWDELEAEQRRYIGSLGEADFGRVIETRRDGQPEHRPLGALLLHVPNHATHHRSEIATMLTMLSGSPPDTGINTYYREKPIAGRAGERTEAGAPAREASVQIAGRAGERTGAGAPAREASVQKDNR